MRTTVGQILGTTFCALLFNCALHGSVIQPQANPRGNLVTVEPDNFEPGADLSRATPGVVLSTFGTQPDFGFPLLSDKVRALFPHNPDAPAPTGELVFGMETFAFETGFYGGGHQFRADFTRPTDFVLIQVAPDNSNGLPDVAMIQIFGVGGTLLDSYTTLGFSENVSFSRPAADISYMIATNPPGLEGDSYMLDRLVFQSTAAIPEPATWPLALGGLAALLLRSRRFSRASL